MELVFTACSSHYFSIICTSPTYNTPPDRTFAKLYDSSKNHFLTAPYSISPDSTVFQYGCFGLSEPIIVVGLVIPCRLHHSVTAIPSGRFWQSRICSAHWFKRYCLATKDVVEFIGLPPSYFVF